jgi:hypothetical protein
MPNISEIYTEEWQAALALIRLAEIPKGQRQDVFNSDLSDLIDYVTYDFAESKRRDAVFRRAESALLAANKKLLSLPAADHHLIDLVMAYLTSSGSFWGKNEPPPIPQFTTYMSRLSEAFALLSGRSPGRKKGDIRDWRLAVLVGGALWYLPQRFGGRPVPFDPDKKQGGGRKFQEAWKALYILAPGVIPANPSKLLRTLKHIRKQVLGHAL